MLSLDYQLVSLAVLLPRAAMFTERNQHRSGGSLARVTIGSL